MAEWSGWQVVASGCGLLLKDFKKINTLGRVMGLHVFGVGQCLLRFMVLWALVVCGVAHAQMTIPYSWSVTPSGAFTAAIPLSLPPGIAGVQPKLGLAYSSQAGNGFIGVGWSLTGLSAITRCPRTLAQDGFRGSVEYDNNDRYCLDGQRLMLVGGSYGAAGSEYRTEIDSQIKVVAYGAQTGSPKGKAGITASPEYFRVWTKSGDVIEYGRTADSRIEAEGTSVPVLWLQNRVLDRNDNYIDWVYTENNPSGEWYLSQVKYTGNLKAGASPTNSVQFVYESRTDAAPVYHAGSLSKMTRRLAKVMAYVRESGAPVMEYRLDYHDGARLAEIKGCDFLGNCLSPASFGYNDARHVFGLPVYWSVLADYSGWKQAQTDVNGDGKTDLLSYYNDNSGWRAWVVLSRGDGRFAPPVSWTSTADYSGWQQSLGDFNGDSQTDLLLHYNDKVSWRAWSAFSRGDGTFAAPILWASVGDYSGWQQSVGDFNGDGRTDLLLYYQDRISWRAWVAFSKGDGTFATPISWVSSADYSGWKQTLGDFNGDGKTDLLLYYNDERGWRVWVALSRGDGTFAVPVQWASLANFGGWRQSLGDFNGDGKTDLLLYFNDQLSWRAWVAFSSGDGGFEAPIPWASPANYSGWDQSLGDFNGDGKTDLLLSYNDGSSWRAWVAATSGEDGLLSSFVTGFNRYSIEYQKLSSSPSYFVEQYSWSCP